MHEIDPKLNLISGKIVNLSMQVHTLLGPGLLERVYEEALCYYLIKEGLFIERQKEIGIQLEQVKLECGFRADIVVEKSVIVEIKTVDRLAPIHGAQLMTYLKLSGLNLGLLLNFNVTSMKDGIKRIVCTKNSANPVNPAFEQKRTQL